VNPLAQQYRTPISLPVWEKVFENLALPIHLDIGCARGKYLMTLADRYKLEKNFIGVEIRQNVVNEAIIETRRRSLGNLFFLHANMNFQQKLLISNLPSSISSVSIFHPDPWMKKRHLKRRLVTNEFVQELQILLPPKTPIYLQTDVEELFEYMTEIFDSYCEAQVQEQNPFGILTDREKFVLDQGGQIYRRTYLV
jgi:tRNA (guanine-N7-)-methyltransferase